MTEASDSKGLMGDARVMAAMHRRQLLRLTAGAAIASAIGCSDDGASDGAEDGACPAIPDETPGPYPGDGSGGADALALAGIVRSDIRASVGGASGVADGVPLTLTITLVDRDCAPLAGRAVYVWHCDRDAGYSMYTGAARDQNYLRGVQETDADGAVTFRSIFPACYPGRWPHIHVEVYPDLASTRDATSAIKTSQLALPRAACDAAYTADGYAASRTHLAAVDLERDGVFRDGAAAQLAEVTGSVATGYVATVTVAVRA